MDGVTLYMLVLAGIILPMAALVAYMAHRERLRDEAEDADRAGIRRRSNPFWPGPQ